MNKKLLFVGLGVGILLSIASTTGLNVLNLIAVPVNTTPGTTNYVVTVTTTNNGVARLVTVPSLLALTGGSTTNLNVLIAGGTTNQLRFTNGILFSVVPQ